jgi:hypothetical protein
VNRTLAPQRVLPLIGFGAALCLVRAGASAVALLFFLGGICFGFSAQNLLLMALTTGPQAAAHLFLTGPIASIAVGLTLISGAQLRPFILLPAALVAGTMLSLAIVVTDPSLHDRTNAVVGVLIGLWIIISVSLTARGFRRRWFEFCGRILGSWLIAIGLLYGGAALLPERQLPISPELLPRPDLDKSFPDIDRSHGETDSAPKDLQEP